MPAEEDSGEDEGHSGQASPSLSAPTRGSASSLQRPQVWKGKGLGSEPNPARKLAHKEGRGAEGGMKAGA